MKKELLYSGKVKSVYLTDEKDNLIIKYSDHATAFNGKKKTSLSDKGYVNNKFNAFIMEKLEYKGIKTHFIKIYNKNSSLVKKLNMIPIEVVIRNISSGSICTRLGISSNIIFSNPIVEYYLKDDSLGDPLINTSHVEYFKFVPNKEINFIKETSLKINNLLKTIFETSGFSLIDFKLEFGRYNGKIILGDEITPDNCRIWDIKTKEIFDKDRFRKDMGDTIKYYKILSKRLGIKL